MLLADDSEIIKQTVHPTWGSGFTAINVDTIRNLLIVCGLLMVMAVVLRLKLRADRPGRFQSIVEVMVDFINGLIKDISGGRKMAIAPLAVCLFMFLLLANWLGLIPLLKSPTNDVNVAVALALMSVVLLHVSMIKAKGPGGYVKHYVSTVQPRWFGPWGWTRLLFGVLEVIQELARPITLSFRLYFNIFVGELMLAIIIFLLQYVSVLLGPVWVLFSIFVGLVQAFIFTMLTIAYIAMGTEKHDDHDHSGEQAAHRQQAAA